LIGLSIAFNQKKRKVYKVIIYENIIKTSTNDPQSGGPLPSMVTLLYANTGLGTMYLNGELDASIGLGGLAGLGIDRSRADLSESADVVTLFSDPHQEAICFFNTTVVYPPHHTTVVRESILDKHSWVAISLMEAFNKSKRIAIERLRRLPPTLVVFGEYYLKDLDKIFRPNPFPYSIRDNVKAFDWLKHFQCSMALRNANSR
jgi:4,5-dihydroxyphthalate decarboxylase